MHCRTGRPASQSILFLGPTPQQFASPIGKIQEKHVGIVDQYVGSALLNLDPDMNGQVPTLISSVLGPLTWKCAFSCSLTVV